MNSPLRFTDPTGLQAGSGADEVIAVIYTVAYEWISRTHSYGGQSVTTRDQIPAAIKYYNYTQSGDLDLPDRRSQATRQLDQYVNSTTMPSIQAFQGSMETLRNGTGYVPALGSLVEAQMAGRDNNYAGVAFNMAMFGADIIPSGGGITRKAVQEGGERLLLSAGSEVPNAGGVIRSFVTSQDQTFYRVFSGTSTRGSFLTATPPRSSLFAQEALALSPSNTANFIQDVLVPAGTRLQRSRALSQPQWGRFRGRGEQFQLLENIPNQNFGVGRPLPLTGRNPFRSQ